MTPRNEAGRAGDIESARRSVAAVWRIEAARIVAALTRVVGDFSLAEDLAQEALADALAQWPETGVPANPGAWLTTVAKRKAIDGWRRQQRYDERMATLAREVAAEEAEALGAGAALPWDPDHIDDDMLRLLFVSCHPVLSREAQVALTLRVVGGLTSEEIAHAFLQPTATVQQRIVRAKKTLAAAKVPFAVPPRAEFGDRLAGVLGVLYLVFNEGHAAAAGEDWMRPDLSREALRLGRALASTVPGESEVHGLVALMELTAARFPARRDADGQPVLLADQDRTRWDRGRILRGRAAMARADALGRGRGAYGLQAAIAETHAVADSVDDTDWERIAVLYEALGRLAPSPVVELNRAVAVSQANGPAAALRIVDGLVEQGKLARYHYLPAARGELLAQLGRSAEARAEYEKAIGLTGNESERALLRRKRDMLG